MFFLYQMVQIRAKGFYFYKNLLYVGNNMVAKQRRATSKSAALSRLKVNRCSYHPATCIVGQETKESMESVKEEVDNANEARYLHYRAHVVELETSLLNKVNFVDITTLKEKLKGAYSLIDLSGGSGYTTGHSGANGTYGTYIQALHLTFSV